MNCQLRYLTEIGEKNNQLNDKLQGIMRKSRYYRKRILVRLGVVNSRSNIDHINEGEIHPGDTVRIRSKSEVKCTLDRTGKIGGCSFLKNQYDCCGNEYKVFKKMDSFYDEKTKRMVRTKNLFLLEDCYCDGVSAYLKPCDRNCFLYWHKNWLEKVS